MTLPLRLLTILLALAFAAPTANADEQTDALRAFKKGIRSKDWKTRQSAYGLMAQCDSAKGADALLSAAVKERNGAVAG